MSGPLFTRWRSAGPEMGGVKRRQSMVSAHFAPISPEEPVSPVGSTAINALTSPGFAWAIIQVSGPACEWVTMIAGPMR